MKKRYILLILAALTASSCEDYLNTKPTMKVSLEQYYNDEGGLNKALTGVYDVMGSVGSMLLATTNNEPSDEGYYRDAGISGTRFNNYDKANGDILAWWTNLYTGIQRANDLIAHIDVPKMDETERQVILGQALFLRGYFYFLLVNRWGDVPLRLTPTTSPIGLACPRTPSAQVYEQIEKDMKKAEELVQANKYTYCERVSKTVVQGMLARVYLQWAGYPVLNVAKYADAAAYAKKVIDSGERGLNVSFKTDPFYDTFNPSAVPVNTSNNAYRQIFINLAENFYDTQESLWEVGYKGNGSDGFGERGAVGSGNGIPYSGSLASTVGYAYGYTKGTNRLFNKYAADGKDLRRDWVLTTYSLANNKDNTAVVRNPIANTVNNQIGRHNGKWRREYEAITPKDKNQTGINFPLLRYADILLMYAEAENQVNGPTLAAIEAVNQVRRRAYGQTNITISYAPSDAATATAAAGGKASFQLFIEDERMRELCFEGLRRTDLLRWGKYVQEMNKLGTEILAQPNTGQRYGSLAGTNAGKRHELYPIPGLEMMNNPLITENNPEWY